VLFISGSDPKSLGIADAESEGRYFLAKPFLERLQEVLKR